MPTLSALVTLNASGQIKAMVISGDPRAKGSPASTLKPFVFGAYLQQVQASQGPAAAARAFFEPRWHNDCGFALPYDSGEGWPAARPGQCGYAPGVRTAWLPHNSDSRSAGFRGGCNERGSYARGSILEALCRSMNTVTAEVALEVGRAPIAATMDDAGLPISLGSWNQAIIGEGELEVSPLALASAYTLFLNQGRRAPPAGVRAMVTGEGLSYPQAQQPKRVFSPEVTGLLRTALNAVVSGSNGTAADPVLRKYRVSGKTGTTQGDGVSKARNIWFVGFQDGERREVTVVWLSYHYPRDKLTKKVPQVKGLDLVGSLYGKHASKVLGAYLDYRAAASPARERGPLQ